MSGVTSSGAVSETRCAMCGTPVRQMQAGRHRRFCSDACRQKAYRRRQASRPHPSSGRSVTARRLRDDVLKSAHPLEPREGLVETLRAREAALVRRIAELEEECGLLRARLRECSPLSYPPPLVGEEWLTPSQVVRMVSGGVVVQTVRNWARRGLIPGVRRTPAGRWLIPASVVRSWVVSSRDRRAAPHGAFSPHAT